MMPVLVHRTAALTGDAVLLLVVVFLLPAVILLIGVPIAFLAWAAGQIANLVF